MKAYYKLKDYLLCLQQLPTLKPADQEACVNRWVEFGDENARRILEECFLPRVLNWVSPYRGLGRDLEDLIEMGNRALLRGLRRFGKNQKMSLEDYLEETVIDGIEAELIVKH